MPWQAGRPESFEYGTGLRESAITRGRSGDEMVTKVVTFTGSAFKPPKGAIPVLVFGADSESNERKEGEKNQDETLEVPIEGWCQGEVLKVGRGRLAVSGEAGMFRRSNWQDPNKGQWA